MMKKIRLPFWLESMLLNNSAQLWTRIDLITKDPNGKIIKSKKFIGRSLVANFLQDLYRQWDFSTASADWGASGAPFNSNRDLIDTTGVRTSLTTATQQTRIDALVGDISKGILFGTGNAAATPSDFQMGAKINHGTGAGQFSYQQQTSTLGVRVSGNNVSCVIQRIAVNSSGGDITVNEVGLNTKPQGIAASFLLYRDVVAGGQLVPNTNTLTCQITFQYST